MGSVADPKFLFRIRIRPAVSLRAESGFESGNESGFESGIESDLNSEWNPNSNPESKPDSNTGFKYPDLDQGQPKGQTFKKNY
jgi:hypothetical protein